MGCIYGDLKAQVRAEFAKEDPAESAAELDQEVKAWEYDLARDLSKHAAVVWRIFDLYLGRVQEGYFLHRRGPHGSQQEVPE